MNYKKQIAVLLSDFIKEITPQEVEKLIELPPKDIDFDYSFPVFILSKEKKKSPQQIAVDLEKNLIKPEFLLKIKAIGPYLNFNINKTFLAKEILTNIFNKREEFGRIESKEIERPLKIVVEYPSPNTNKPLHLGIIRNIFIGQSVSNLLRFIGNEIFEVNLYNDRGIHICKSMLAYQKWGHNKRPEDENIKSDHFVGKFYVLFNEKLQNNPDLNQEAEDLLHKWENNDPNIRAIWKMMNTWAKKGFNESFSKLDVKFDKEYFESDIYKKGKEIINTAINGENFEQVEDNAVIARLEKYNLPDKVLLRSDGTSLYVTQDIYLAKKKKEDFNYDKSIYVVGNEQNTYFKQLFKILELLGFSEEMIHLNYGMVYLPEGKMKSREGQTVDADEIIEEVYNLAKKEILKRYNDLNEEEIEKRSRIIGQAALRFYILKYDPKKDFTYYPDKSISFEGNTGPYIQYVYARIQSIINKTEVEIDLDIDFSLLKHKTEKELIFNLYQFPEILKESAEFYKPHFMCQYLLNLSQHLNSFYVSCQVITSEINLQKARLLLIRCIQIVIKIGLNLLGIEILEQM